MPLDELILEESISPHVSDRQGAPICMLVYHYTGASTINGTLAWFKDPVSRVSAHYVIGRTRIPEDTHGDLLQSRVVRMVNHSRKAWHAGKSEWEISESLYQVSRGVGATWKLPKNDYGARLISGVNQCSIGLELVGKGNSFPEVQMKTVAMLTARLLKSNDLLVRENCVGHEDVSPGRKVDPGVNFDYDFLWHWVDKFLGLATKTVKIIPLPDVRLFELKVKEDHKMKPGRDVKSDRVKSWWMRLLSLFR